MNNLNPLDIPEILAHVGHYLPLWHKHPSHQSTFHPQYLLSACLVSHHWRRTLLPILWYLHASSEMDSIPLAILRRNAFHTRILEGAPSQRVFEILASSCQELKKVKMSSRGDGSKGFSFSSCEKLVRGNFKSLKVLEWEVGLQQGMEVGLLRRHTGVLQDLELKFFDVQKGGSLWELLEPVKGTLKRLVLGFELRTVEPGLFLQRVQDTFGELEGVVEEVGGGSGGESRRTRREGLLEMPALTHLEIVNPLVEWDAERGSWMDCSEILGWCPHLSTFKLRKVANQIEVDAFVRTLGCLMDSKSTRPGSDSMRLQVLELEDTRLEQPMPAVERQSPGLAKLLTSYSPVGVKELRLVMHQIGYVFAQTVIAASKQAFRSASQPRPERQGGAASQTLESLYLETDYRRAIGSSTGDATAWLGLENLAQILKECPGLKRFEYRVYFLDLFLWLVDLLWSPQEFYLFREVREEPEEEEEEEVERKKLLWSNLVLGDNGEDNGIGSDGRRAAMESVCLVWKTTRHADPPAYQTVETLRKEAHKKKLLQARATHGSLTSEEMQRKALETQMMGQVHFGWKVVSVAGAEELLPVWVPSGSRYVYIPPTPTLVTLQDRVEVLEKMQGLLMEGRPWAGVRMVKLNGVVFERVVNGAI